MSQIDSATRSFEKLARLMVPLFVMLLLFVLNMVVFPFFYAEDIRPHFFLMGVFYWAIYRPTLIPPSLCFLSGLLMDFLTGVPPGLNAFFFTVAQWLVRDQRRYLMGQPYIVIWAMFCLMVLVVSTGHWAMFALVRWQADFILPALTDAVVSAALFPFITLLLVVSHRVLPVITRPYD